MKIKNLLKGKISNLSTRQIKQIRFAFKEKPCVLCRRCSIEDFQACHHSSLYYCRHYENGGFVFTDTKPYSSCCGWIPNKDRIRRMEELNIKL